MSLSPSWTFQDCVSSESLTPGRRHANKVFPQPVGLEGRDQAGQVTKKAKQTFSGKSVVICIEISMS